MRPSQAQTTPKKPYQAPKLLIYGNLTEMTKARGTKGRLDGAKKGIKRRTAV
jgi:hypothetical protein